jgi:hypothetical protein
MRWSPLLLLGLAIGFPACSDPSPSAGPVALKAGRPLYRAGEAVSLTVRNLSGNQLQYSQCFPNLEQQESGGMWRTIHVDASPCLGIVEELDGYGLRIAHVSLPNDLSAGIYRVRFPMIGTVPSKEEPFVVAAQTGGEFEVQP